MPKQYNDKLKSRKMEAKQEKHTTIKRILVKFVLMMFLPLLLISCSIQRISSQKKIINEFETNQVLTAELGETMVSIGEKNIVDAVKIIDAPDCYIDLKKYPIKSGEILPLIGSQGKWLLYYNEGTNYNNFGIAINKNDNSDVRALLVQGWKPVVKKDETLKIEKTTLIDNKDEDCYLQEFLYNGKNGNSLKFAYREYIGNMARPAYFQDLQYDISESKIVGFKGLRIEIIEATNTFIKYKITKQFDALK